MIYHILLLTSSRFLFSFFLLISFAGYLSSLILNYYLLLSTLSGIFFFVCVSCCCSLLYIKSWFCCCYDNENWIANWCGNWVKFSSWEFDVFIAAVRQRCRLELVHWLLNWCNCNTAINAHDIRLSQLSGECVCVCDVSWLIDAAGARINNWLDFPPHYAADQSIPAQGNVRGVAVKCWEKKRRKVKITIVAFAWLERITDEG